MNRFAAAGAAVLVLVAAAACEAGAREPRSGIVTDLGYTEAEHWTETECGYTYDWDGRYRHSCWTDSGIDPECWWVEFEDEAGIAWEDCVAQEVWKSLVIGDVYTSE